MNNGISKASVVASAIALLAAAAGILASTAAHAQSSYSIPNPLMRPQAMAAEQRALAPSVPSAREPIAVPPLPTAISEASLYGRPGSVNAPGNETIIRDTLGTFTVTAIVGDRAVLRNNVGSILTAPSSAEARAPAAGGAAAADPRASARQAVIRVKTSVPVYISGIELTPLVMESRVEFRLAGRKQVVATVMLESQSSYGYVPAATNRETADPAVSGRVAPGIGGATLGSNADAVPTTGSNGLSSTQR